MSAYKSKLGLDGTTSNMLGPKYWKIFKHRNKELLDSDSRESQTVTRREWSTHQNLTKIYNLVYQVMDDARILQKLETPVWMDINKKIVLGKIPYANPKKWLF